MPAHNSKADELQTSMRIGSDAHLQQDPGYRCKVQSCPGFSTQTTMLHGMCHVSD